jgi:hypothetical protein
MTYYIDTDKYIDNSIVLFTVGYKKKRELSEKVLSDFTKFL